MKTSVMLVFSFLFLAWCWGGGAETPPSVAAEAEVPAEAPRVVPTDLPEYLAAWAAMGDLPSPEPVQYTAEDWAIMRSENPHLNLPEEPGYHTPSPYLTDEQKQVIANFGYWQEMNEIHHFDQMTPNGDIKTMTSKGRRDVPKPVPGSEFWPMGNGPKPAGN